ncbi:MAG: 30S ribosomal protein S1 [Candidatus Aureabacteria bacterium]|nr:30S ribosomal protein S1 [Candidatus Auribacterota bacterium]
MIEQKEQIQPISGAEEDFASLLNAELQKIKPETVTGGTIRKINPDNVWVDIGYKSDGIIPIEDFRDISQYQVGDKVDVFIETLENEEGRIVLSKIKADKIQNWEKTVAACEEGKIVSGRIYKRVKGGLMVDVGMDAFLPASQIELKNPKNLDDYVGQTYDFKVIKINYERKNIVLSRRILLEEEKKRDKSKFFEKFKVGDIVEGLVKNITDFGAFIDLDGIDGLLHITDMSWKRIKHPSEMLAIGDRISVKILEIDREKERVSLGLKQKTENPWDTITDRYPIGSKVTGRVVNILPYGAFVELEDGVEGLMHISELSWIKRIHHPSEMLSIGDTITAVVLNLEKEGRKISLGLKQLNENPWDTITERYKAGQKVSGTVRNLTNYGIFLRLEEGIDGLIHVSDLSWTQKITNPNEVYKKGDVLEAVVLSVDQENRKISLGIKQLEEDPWEKLREDFPVGNVVKGTVTKITKFGAFIRLKDNFEGLVHISQIGMDHVNDISNLIKMGDEVDVKVLEIDSDEKKISLSMKEVYLDSQKKRKGITTLDSAEGSGELDKLKLEGLSD